MDSISFDTSVYVFCAVGIRSAIAAYNLKQVGYTESEIKAIIEKTFENSKIESKARADFAQLELCEELAASLC